MKKNLLVLLLLLLGMCPLRADLMWYEGYNYSNGPIIIEATNIWFRHSGSANPSDAIVSNNMEQVASSSSVAPYPNRTDDVHRLFPATYTNSGPIPVFASFTVIVTNQPAAAAGYFAHFTDNTSSDFFGRLFAFTGTNLALPNTFRLGISATAASPSKIYPMDLALNTPYQVVVEYDTGNLDATLWVNPISSSDPSVVTSDAVSVSLQNSVMQAYAFRQASGMGNFFAEITNLAVATTFSDAATNIWTTNAVTPTIVYPLVGYTNAAFISNSISIVASGQGLANLTYQWQLNGTNISTLPDGGTIGNSNVLTFAVPQTNDTGNYSVVVTTPYGLSVTSSAVSVYITNSTAPPFVTQEPTNTSAYPAQNVTLTVGANGVPPITYQWNYAGNPILGANNPTYTITDLQSNNGTTGIYNCAVINNFGTNFSSNATVSVVIPPVLSIYALRGEVDPVFFLPTNSASAYYTVVGTVVNRTNMAASPNYQAAITDGSAGISVYCYGGLTTTPNLGDVIQVTGPVDNYSSLEEFEIYSTDPSTSVTIISSNNPAPLPTVLPLTFTNSPVYGTPTNIAISNALHRFESTLVMLTNIYIVGGGGSNTINGQDYTLTDASGSNSITYYAYYGTSNVIGQPLPAFCYTLTGVMSEYLGASATDRSSGYEFLVTSYNDFVTNPAPPMTLAATGTGTVTWTAVPYSYPYSIYGATNVTGPYVLLKTGMVFPTTAGSYTDTNVTAKMKFYQVTSP